MMKNNMKYGFLFVAVMVILVLVIKKVNKEIANQADMALQESILDDYYQRMGEVPSAASEKHRNKVKHTSIDLDGEIIEYTFEDSVYVEEAKRLANQCVLARMNSFNPDSFNTAFRKRLEQFSISGETGVIYSFQNHNLYSNKDSVSVLSARYQSSKTTLDLLKEASVCVWVNYNVMTVVQHAFASPFLWISLLVVWVSISWRGFYLKRKGKPELQEQKLTVVEVMPEVKILKEPEVVQKIEALSEMVTVSKMETVPEIENKMIPQEEKEEPIPVNLLPEKETIPDGLYVSPLRQLYINKKQVSIQPLRLKILELLIKEMEHERYASREYIRDVCWKDLPINDANERLDTHIRKIRKLLQNSGYEIITIRKEGFLLKKTA